MLTLQWLSPAAGAREVAATVTFAEGRSALTSGAQGLVPMAGVQLRHCDIVRTGPQGMMQIETEDGGQILLGPDSRFLVELPSLGEPVVGPHFLLSGWAKITVPKRDKGPPHRINSPHFDVLIDNGVTVLRVAADGSQFYVELGDAMALFAANPGREAVRAGRTYTRKAEQPRGSVEDRLDPAFAKAVPLVLRDTLPSLLAKVKARIVVPKSGPAQSAAEAEEWLKAVPLLRNCANDDTLRSAQEALTRQGFDVGPIDGVMGPRTMTALREFQQRRGLSPSGRLDPETLRALDIAGPR